MHFPSVRRIAGAAALLAFAVPAGGQTVDRRTVAGASVAIHNLVGAMVVEGTSSGGDVTVEITRRGRDASGLRVETGPRGDWQTLRIVYPERRIVYPELSRGSRSSFNASESGWLDSDGDGWGGRNRVEVRGTGEGFEGWADLRVLVPRGKRLSVHLGVGRMDVANVEGDIRVRSASGRLTTTGTRGQLQVESGSGGARISDATGEVTLDLGSGGAQLTNVKGTRLEVSSGSGGFTGRDIDVQVLRAETGSGGARFLGLRARDIDIETGSGGSEVELLNDPNDVSIETGSGGITLRMPTGSGGEVDIETGSGSIDTDFEVRVTRIARNTLRGTMGDGRGRIRIEAGSGSVKLIRR